MKLQIPVFTPGQAPSLEDDALGSWLIERVEAAVARRGAPTMAVLVEPEAGVRLLGLRPVQEAGLNLATFVASLTRAGSETGPRPLAVGLVGTVWRRPRGEGRPVPSALVFLEWSDCRWWHWSALIQPDAHEVRPDTATLRRAVDGDPLPDGLGRWWSLARRHRLSAQLRPVAPEPSDVVH